MDNRSTSEALGLNDLGDNEPAGCAFRTAAILNYHGSLETKFLEDMTSGQENLKVR